MVLLYFIKFILEILKYNFGVIRVSRNLIIHYRNTLNKKFKFSKDFISTVAASTSGFIKTDALDSLFQSFENETINYYFTRESETNLHRIINAVFDKISFLNDCLIYPHHVEILIAISASSNYMTDIVVRNPEYLYLVFKDNFLRKRVSQKELEKELLEGIGKYNSLNSKLGFLRLFKSRYLLKIGLSDILKISSLEKIIEEISVLAYAINSILFDLCLNTTLKKYNLELKRKRYCLIALGKMGGNELNYSSDIDLILFFDKNTKPWKNFNKDYFEILNEAVQLFIQSSSEITDKGFLYRVDFRLRPDGSGSPLCRTINDTINYYETRGEDWEKQMLIKANYLSGNRSLYKIFSDFKNSYVNKSSLERSPIQQIKMMKLEIEKYHTGKENVKTFWGGIRDIEFSVQALQLLNGKRIDALKTGNTLNAINILETNSILSKKEKIIFSEAYELFRKVEHFLQLMNNKQTHDLPGDDEILNKLSDYLGYISVPDFENDLIKRRRSVRKVFNSIFGKDKQKIGSINLTEINFTNRKRAEKNFNFLKGVGLSNQKSFDTRTITLFKNIEPSLVNYLKKSKSPEKVLDNFIKIISLTKFPSIYYHELLNNEFFNSILKICEKSQLAIDLLSVNPPLNDLLFSRKCFTKTISNLYAQISFQEMKFILAIQFSLKLIDDEIVSVHLSRYIKFKLNKILIDNNIEYNYFIAGLGSFGIEEMTFFSDVDLIVVVNEIDPLKNMDTDFQQFLSTARKKLHPLEIDFRLRPEGKNSPLVWDILNYKNYLKSRAGVWEFQSLLKLQFVSGNKQLFNNFKKIVITKIKNLKIKSVKEEIKKMHNIATVSSFSHGRNLFYFKKNSGGLLTIDYLIQTLIITHNELLSRAVGKNQRKNIERIMRSFPELDDIISLKKNYLFIKKLEMISQNLMNVSKNRLPIEKENLQVLAEAIELKDSYELVHKLNLTARSNNQLFMKYLG